MCSSGFLVKKYNLQTGTAQAIKLGGPNIIFFSPKKYLNALKDAEGLCVSSRRATWNNSVIVYL